MGSIGAEVVSARGNRVRRAELVRAAYRLQLHQLASR